MLLSPKEIHFVGALDKVKEKRVMNKRIRLLYDKTYKKIAVSPKFSKINEKILKLEVSPKKKDDFASSTAVYP